MVPGTIVVPEMNVAVLAGVFHPVGLLGMLAALVVVVAVGLCVVIALQGSVPPDRARRGRGAPVRPFHPARPGSEPEGAAA